MSRKRTAVNGSLAKLSWDTFDKEVIHIDNLIIVAAERISETIPFS